MGKTAKAVKQKFVVELEFETMEGLGGGFRQNWISGKGHGIEFDLDTGAGMGNPMFTLNVRQKKKSLYFTADIRPMVQKLVAEIVEKALA